MRGLRYFRWTIFLLALVTDLAFFYYFEPFTPQSFMAAGGAAVIIYIFIAFLFSRIKRRGRIRRALKKDERIVHDVGFYWLWVVGNVWGDKSSRLWIGLPFLIAFLTTLYFVFDGLYWIDGLLGLGYLAWLWFPYDVVPHNGYVMVFYVALLLAIPRTVYHVLEWSTSRYVITTDRIMIHSGIFGHRLRSIKGERVVDSDVDLTWIQDVLGYGDLKLHLTAGGDEARTLVCLPDPKGFDKIREEVKEQKLRERHELPQSVVTKDGEKVKSTPNAQQEDPAEQEEMI